MDENKLERARVIYALTRHETISSNKNCKVIDFCGPTQSYIGSHDAFVFKLSSPISQNVLKRINYHTNMESIEQVIIYNLRKYGNFMFKNPCKILYIFHNHCTGYRIANERFVGKKKILLYKYLKMGNIKLTKMKVPFSGL